MCQKNAYLSYTTVKTPKTSNNKSVATIIINLLERDAATS
jgi:hypothetical protein